MRKEEKEQEKKYRVIGSKNWKSRRAEEQEERECV